MAICVFQPGMISVRQVCAGLCLVGVRVILHGDLCFSAWDQSDTFVQVCVWLESVKFYMAICVFQPGIISVRQVCAGLCLAESRCNFTWRSALFSLGPVGQVCEAVCGAEGSADAGQGSCHQQVHRQVALSFLFQWLVF